MINAYNNQTWAYSVHTADGGGLVMDQSDYLSLIFGYAATVTR